MFDIFDHDEQADMSVSCVEDILSHCGPYIANIKGQKVLRRWRSFERHFAKVRKSLVTGQGADFKAGPWDSEEEVSDAKAVEDEDDGDEEDVVEDAADTQKGGVEVEDEDVDMAEPAEAPAVAESSQKSAGGTGENSKGKKVAKGKAVMKYMEYDPKKHTHWANPVSVCSLLSLLRC